MDKLERASTAKRIGELLAGELKKDPLFYFFSPDETTSNKFEVVFGVEKRAWGGLRQEKWDLPEGAGGRIIEMLSENILFSVMTGHLANGERAMMGSYEAFYSVITSQILQEIKFIKQLKEVRWRKALPAVNLLSTSVCWRQDHNGFTHQSPALISTLLAIPSNLTNCIFPIDDLAGETAFKFMLGSENVVNLTTFDKNERRRYSKLSDEGSKINGATIYTAISDKDPDFVITACGDIVAHEAIEAIRILREDMPELKLRFVYIDSLSYRGIGIAEEKMTKERFREIFAPDKPIVGNFHGYPETLENILENYTGRERLRVHGFNEEGSTTTPFEMLRRNAASRYDLAIDIARMAGRADLASKYRMFIKQNHLHAAKYDEDLIK